MSQISFNTASYANQIDKDRATNSSKDNMTDDIVHLNENNQFDRADLEGALKSGKENILVKSADGKVYSVNVKEELSKLNDALKTKDDGSADAVSLKFSVSNTVTKTEVKDIEPTSSKFSFSLKDGKNTLKEVKKMGINLKDGISNDEVKAIINQLKSEGATKEEMQSVIDQVNNSRKMKKNDQTLSVQEDDKTIKYEVQDNTVKTKKGPIRKTEDGNFDVKLPGIGFEGKFDVTKKKDGKFDVGLGITVEKGKKTLFAKTAEEVKAGIKLLDGENTKSELKKLGIDWKNGISSKEYDVIVAKLKEEKPDIKPEEINKFFEDLDANGVDNRITVKEESFKTDCGEDTKVVVGGTKGDDIPETKTRKGITIPTIKIGMKPHADIKLPEYTLETPKPVYKPGKFDIDLPKFSRDKSTTYDKGFEGTIDKKQTITTTEEVPEDVVINTDGIKPTPKPEPFNAQAYQDYVPNYVRNDVNAFDVVDKGVSLKLAKNKTPLVIECSGSRLYEGGTILTKQEQRVSELNYDGKQLKITSSADTDRGTNVHYGNLNFAALGEKGKDLKAYFDEGIAKGSKPKSATDNNSNDYLSVGRGLEMANDYVTKAFAEYKMENPNATIKDFVENMGDAPIILKAHDEAKGMVMPKELNFTVADIVNLYGIK